jgi:hypothetical protein
MGLAKIKKYAFKNNLEKKMINQSIYNAGSIFESVYFIEDFLPILSVIAFGYIVSCLALTF